MVSSSTHALGCVNPHPLGRCTGPSEGVEPPSLRAAVGASLPESLSEAPQKASCFPSQSHLAFCFPNHHPLPLITGIGCLPNSTHGEERQPAGLRLIPQAAAGCVQWGPLKQDALLFSIITKTRCAPFRKLKIHMQTRINNQHAIIVLPFRRDVFV